MKRKTKRTLEICVAVLAGIVFIVAVGRGIFDVYIQDFTEGIDILLQLGKHSAEAIVAVAALIIAVIAATGGLKKRKR